MTYTPGTPNTRPLKYTLPTYVNTPEIRGFVKSISAYEINQHTKRLKDLRISGFNLVFKGMFVSVSGGVCILPDGQKLSHCYSGFYIDRELPLEKSETFYLSVSLSRRNAGEAVIFLFNNRPSDDWRILKIINIPKDSEDLSNAEVINNFSYDRHRVYSYIPKKPTGSINLIKLPYLIDGKTVKAYSDGELVPNILVTVQHDRAYISMPAIDVSKPLVLDFDILF